MLNFKTLNVVIVMLIFSALLNNCAATPPPVATSPMQEESAPEPQTALPESAAEAPADLQKEETIELSAEDTSQTYIEEHEEPSFPVKVPIDYADIEFIQHRLIVYENKFEKWLDISETALKGPLAEEITSLETECMQNLEGILSGYSRLMERIPVGEIVAYDKTGAVEPKHIQQLDIAFLESRCNELLAMDFAWQYEPLPVAEPELTFTAAQEAIATHVKKGDYQAALDAYEGLSRDFPDREPSLATLLDFGRALQYTGQVEAATRHYKHMLDSGDLAIEPLSIKREVGDLLLASDNAAAAEFYYESMILEHQSISAEEIWAQEQLTFLRSFDPGSEDMVTYMKILREFQTHDYKMHAPRLNELVNNFARVHAGNPIAMNALRLKTFAANQMKAWFGRQLVRIDALVAEERFTEASDILKDISGYHLPAELQAVLQKTFYDVAQAEIQAMEEQRRMKEMELTEQWDSAVNLLDSQQYELAISAFESLSGTEYEEKAKIKIIEAANQAAGEMRKEAASLFIRAGKTTDIELKKALLLNSHRLLTEILDKYPQTELLDKVQQNISILEEQIERFDPALLEELQQQNPAETTAFPYGLEP
ncbi:MAG: hypothetical protein JRF05_05385 [Deltaproteobacteria bacterium]|jgi:outer membrane protein assembly factor BamD (BamD/ComL family)|nr:hypothetical protein [Deltaproteobacteria bacterium]